MQDRLCKQLQKRLYNVKKSGSTKKKDEHKSTGIEETPPKKPKLGESSSSELTKEDFVPIPGKFYLQL